MYVSESIFVLEAFGKRKPKAGAGDRHGGEEETWALAHLGVL